MSAVSKANAQCRQEGNENRPSIGTDGATSKDNIVKSSSKYMVIDGLGPNDLCLLYRICRCRVIRRDTRTCIHI